MSGVAVPLLLQVSGSAIPSTPWEMVTGGQPLTQGVFAILVVLSLVSWAVMFAKWREFARVRKSGDGFMRDFEHAATLDEAGRAAARLRLVLDTQTNAERDRLSRMLPWLATIGAVSPLLGLLGTVIGVIYAFLGIARSGSGNLSAVAPGVAEALVATALALAVAIPAVMGYNIFASRLNRVDGELEGFGSELIALLVREGRI